MIRARGGLGGRIYEALRGRPQKWLAEELGVTPAAVSEWVRGDGFPSFEKLAQLPAVLGVSGHWLLTGQPPIERGGAGEADLERLDRVARSETAAVILGAITEALAGVSARLDLPDPATPSDESVEPAEGEGVLDPSRGQRPRKRRRKAE